MTHMVNGIIDSVSRWKVERVLLFSPKIFLHDVLFSHILFICCFILVFFHFLDFPFLFVFFILHFSLIFFIFLFIWFFIFYFSTFFSIGFLHFLFLGARRKRSNIKLQFPSCDYYQNRFFPRYIFL